MIITFGLFVVFFLVIVEIITVLFRLTGVPEEKARFQVLSLLTTTGFTTRESELITQHQTRRTLAYFTMVMGYVGIATLISFLISILKESFHTQDLIKLVIVLLVVVFFVKNKPFIDRMDTIIEKIARKRMKSKTNLRKPVSY